MSSGCGLVVTGPALLQPLTGKASTAKGILKHAVPAYIVPDYFIHVQTQVHPGGSRGRSRIYGFAGESTSAMNRPARIVFGKSGRPVSSSRGSGIAGADPHFVRCDRRRYFWQLKPTTFGRLRSDYMSSCHGTFFSGAAGSGLMLSGCRGEICARQANKTGLASGGEEEEEKMMSLKGCQRLRFSRGRSSALTGDAK